MFFIYNQFQLLEHRFRVNLQLIVKTQFLQYSSLQSNVEINIKIKIRMQKSKSQQKIPTPKSSLKPTKSEFIYKTQDDMYLFQNRQLFMQVEFRSPIKQICEYLEQYEKYFFLSQISSVGIKATQQRQFYEKLTSAINRQFQKYLQKTLLYVEQMIMNVHFMKYQRWHYYSRVVQGYKRNLLNKDIDCYDFNKGQFQPYLKNVMQYLKNIDQRLPIEETKKRKMQIISNRKLIQKKVGQIHQTMYVKNPFKPQNEKRIQVRSDQLFQSYIKRFFYQTTTLQKALDIRFHNCYDNIRKFPEFLKQFSLKGQTIAIGIIKQYNQTCANLKNVINKSYLNSEAKSDLQLTSYYSEWKKGDKITPILKNKMQKVVLSNRIIVRDAEKSDNYCVIMPEQVKYSLNQKYEQDDQIFNSRVPANNPYFDFFAHIYDRNRLRKLHLFYQLPKVTKKYVNQRELYYRYKKRFVKQKVIVEQNIYHQLINQKIIQQQKVWQSKNNLTQNERKLYELDQNVNLKSRCYLHQSSRKTQQIKNSIKQKRLQQYKERLQKQQKQKKVMDELAPVRLKKSNSQRNYNQFLVKFGIKESKKQVTAEHIVRYGIKIAKHLFQNKESSKLEQFLCNYLKQKLFRDVDKYKDKQSMPLMFNVKPPQQFCNWRTIKRLGELTKTFKKYYIWASQIIKYEQETSIKKQTTGRFTIYAFSDLKHSKSILFQLKRRLNIKVTGQIVEIYNTNDPLGFEEIISKFEVMHRLLFGMHIETPDHEESFKRGHKIYNLLVRQLSNQVYLTQ